MGTYLLRTLLLTVALCSGCGGGGGSEPDAGPYDDGFATDPEAFAPFSGQILGLFQVAHSGVTIDAQGALVTLAADQASLTVELLHSVDGSVAGPFELAPDPAAPGGFRVDDVSLFGGDQLSIRARVRIDGPDGDEVMLLVLPTVEASARVITPSRGDAERRAAMLARYTQLMVEENLCNALVRFATLVQDIVDTAVTLDSNRINRTIIIADDMQDLFIGPQFDKGTTMITQPTLTTAIPDPGASCDLRTLTGFAGAFQLGEGRFRHFTANHAASQFAPGVLVNLAARITGGDWGFLADPTGDIAADLATNEAGRDFNGFMATANLTDGRSVRDWIIDRFDDAFLQEHTSMHVTLIETVGPYAVGTEVGLCRIGPGCNIAPNDACPNAHLHAPSGSLLFDDTGPYPEPPNHVNDCGYGVVEFGDPPP